MTSRPYSRYLAVDLVISFLTEREEHRIQDCINRLSRENRNRIGKDADGFIFKGTYYWDTTEQTHYTEHHVLDLSLHGDMEQILLDRQLTLSETQKTRQGLVLLFKGCENWQDARDALPEFLVPALDLQPPLPRTREEGWTFQDSPARRLAYKSIRDILEVRNACRLIY